MILKNSTVDYASRLEETEKRNAELPEWMMHDRSIEGYMIDTRFVPDRMDYETMAWAAKAMEDRPWGYPKLEYHADTLEDAIKAHKMARKELVNG